MWLRNCNWVDLCVWFVWHIEVVKHEPPGGRRGCQIEGACAVLEKWSKVNWLTTRTVEKWNTWAGEEALWEKLVYLSAQNFRQRFVQFPQWFVAIVLAKLSSIVVRKMSCGEFETFSLSQIDWNFTKTVPGSHLGLHWSSLCFFLHIFHSGWIFPILSGSYRCHSTIHLYLFMLLISSMTCCKCQTSAVIQM